MKLLMTAENTSFDGGCKYWLQIGMAVGGDLENNTFLEEDSIGDKGLNLY